MRILRILGVVVLSLMISITFAASQTWEPLTNQPTFNPGVTLLLTDGTVIALGAQLSHLHNHRLQFVVQAHARQQRQLRQRHLDADRLAPQRLRSSLFWFCRCCPTAGWSSRAENTTAPVEAVTQCGPTKALFTIR